MRRARPLLGTIVEIDATGAGARAEEAIEAAFDAVADIHRLMSFHDPASDVSRLNREAADHPVAVDDRTFRVLQFAIELHAGSGGLFDISAAGRLRALGLLSSQVGAEERGAPICHSRQAEGLTGNPEPRERSSELPLDSRSPLRGAGNDAREPNVGITTWGTSRGIELTPDRRVLFHDPDTRIDLGGIAKGFAVDRAIAVLRDHFVPEGLVNAGGDLAAFGERPWTVHLRDPRTPTRLLEEIAVRNEAVASSAGRFDPFRSSTVLGSAIVDPDTGKIASAIAGASVWALSCMAADALTKVVMLAGERAGPLLKDYRARALFMTADGDVFAMADWQEAHLAD